LAAERPAPGTAAAARSGGGVSFPPAPPSNEAEGWRRARPARRDHRPFGLYGGSPGRPSENYLNPGNENRVLPGKFTMNVRRGDIFRHVLAGAGGYGDPLERDAAAVLKDVRNELLSPARPAADSGVIIDTPPWTVEA